MKLKDLIEVTKAQHGCFQWIIVYSNEVDLDLAEGCTLYASQFKPYLDRDVKRISSHRDGLIITINGGM